MKFESETIKKAWMIRKSAAEEIECGVMEVLWSVCLELAEISYITSSVTVVEKAHVEVSITRKNGVSETIKMNNVSKMTDVLWGRIVEANKTAGTVCHGYENVPAKVDRKEICKRYTNGDLLDMMDNIMNKAHGSSIMTMAMNRKYKMINKYVA